MTDTEALRAIVHEALLRPSPLEQYRPSPTRRQRHGPVELLALSGGGPDLNNVLILGEAEPAAVFALADEFFGAARGYSVSLEVEAAGAMEHALVAGGWVMDEEEPALVLARLPESVPPAPAGLQIRRVATEQDFAAFRAIGGPSPSILPSLAAALDPDVSLFLGEMDGRVAATSRLVCLGDIAEITGVVTDPAYRRRGFGTAMTWAAVMAGAVHGCTTATLTATAMGYPVYVKMGFVPVCTLRTYLLPSS
jgi:ribosomal protein S18 acetylase RimI-like enzyme